MAIPKLLLLLSAASFAGFGCWLLVAPTALEGLTSIGLSEAAARTEIRAMYGGLELGIAGFLGWCARSQARYEAGLMLSALAFLGFAAARLTGMTLDGAWTPVHLAALTAETVGFILASRGLALVARDRGSAQ